MSSAGLRPYNPRVKYTIIPGDNDTLRVTLTRSGRVREFLAGAGKAGFWVAIAMAVIFAPDYIFRFSGEGPEMMRAIWGSAAAIVGGFALYFGYRRGLATRAWEVDRTRGLVRRHALTLTLAKIVDLEIPLNAIAPGGDERDVAFELPGGSVYIVARRPGEEMRQAIAKAVFGGTE